VIGRRVTARARVSPPAPKPEPVFPDAPVACPECGGTDIAWDFTCHTWGGKEDGTGWKACMPCDSAIQYYCRGNGNDYCWNYTHGLNPGNPRSVANDARRPPWLPEKIESRNGFLVTHPQVRSAWADDDD
jgi:hypothetical protein